MQVSENGSGPLIWKHLAIGLTVISIASRVDVEEWDVFAEQRSGNCIELSSIAKEAYMVQKQAIKFVSFVYNTPLPDPLLAWSSPVRIYIQNIASFDLQLTVKCS